MPALPCRSLLLITTFALALGSVGCKKQAKKPAGGDTPPPVHPDAGGDGGSKPVSSTPPAGWCEARDAVGGYRVFMPGDRPVSPDFSKAGGQEAQHTGCYAGMPNRSIPAEVHTFSLLPTIGFKLGTAPEELFAALKVFNRVIDSHHDVLEKTPAMLGGKPALKVVLKKKSTRPPDEGFGNDPGFDKFRNERIEQDKKEQAKRQIFYLTNSNTRLIILQIDTPGEPDPAIIKTVTESFRFL
ncbi:MAG TPA: hypothetical protein VLM40_10570 [Gemmata sp.]|nr:hypothetical protein [Gemmata sp.]